MIAWNIFLRDYRIRFRRTFLGAFWYLMPMLILAGAAVYFGIDLGLYSENTRDSYIAGLVVSLVIWQLFTDSWNEPLRFGRRTRTVLRSVILDQNALLLAGVISALVGLMIKLPIVIGVLLFVDVFPSQHLYLIPIAIISVIAAGIALAGFTLPLSLNFLDLRYGIPIVQIVLLLSTPIFYPEPEGGIIAAINHYNPLTYLISPARNLILGLGVDLRLSLIAAATTFSLLALALYYFHNKIRLAIAYIGR